MLRVEAGGKLAGQGIELREQLRDDLIADLYGSPPTRPRLQPRIGKDVPVLTSRRALGEGFLQYTRLEQFEVVPSRNPQAGDSNLQNASFFAEAAS
jgi:hypothetical protein